MKWRGLDGFFESFLLKDSLFLNKRALQSTYTPTEIVHRGGQIDQVANILAPSLRLEKPSNLFIYGKTGSGKTLSIKYTTEKINNIAGERDLPLKIVYVNCKLKKTADTEYRLIAELTRHFGKQIPPTGLPTEEVYKVFFNTIDERKQTVILVLDEIDHLVKKAGDEVLYSLTRVNDELQKAQVSIIGISNDLIFADNLDPRVKSSLSEEEVVFPPYNALQLQDILRKRSAEAFVADSLQTGVIEKCAAYAAREHGDARRALELLRVAGEVAERSGSKSVTLEHIDAAEEKIERDRVLDIVETQPKQIQAALYAILSAGPRPNSACFTGDVYHHYLSICSHSGLRPLTQRRISDVIAELDMLGVITAAVISKGRYGRTRQITISIPAALRLKIKTLLQQQLGM